MNRYDERRAYDIFAIANYTNLPDVPKGMCNWFGGVVSSIVNRGRSRYDIPELIPVFIESVSDFMDLYPAPEIGEPYGDKMRSYAERMKEVYGELSAWEKQHFLENVGMSEAILLAEMKRIEPALESKIHGKTKDGFDLMLESMSRYIDLEEDDAMIAKVSKISPEMEKTCRQIKRMHNEYNEKVRKNDAEFKEQQAKYLKEMNQLAKEESRLKMSRHMTSAAAKAAVIAGGIYVANSSVKKEIKYIKSKGKSKLNEIKRIKDTIQSETERVKNTSRRKSNRIRAIGKVYIDRINSVYNQTAREYEKVSKPNKRMAIMEKNKWKELEKSIDKAVQEAKKLLANFHKEIKELKS